MPTQSSVSPHTFRICKTMRIIAMVLQGKDYCKLVNMMCSLHDLEILKYQLCVGVMRKEAPSMLMLIGV